MLNFKRINNLSLPILNIDSLGFTIEKENIPFYFMLDSNMIATSFFIPIKEMPDLTSEYVFQGNKGKIF